MLTNYVRRGTKAGAVGGIALGAFVATVGNPLVGYAETFETGGHGGGPVVSGAVTTLVSVAGGVLFGILLGAVVLGAGYYILEPLIPGQGPTKSYLLAAAGFVATSGAPWLVLPPQPPGVEQTLGTGTRLGLFFGMVVAGALACLLAGYAYTRLRPRYGRPLATLAALAPLAFLFVLPAFAPTNSVSGPIPERLASIFRTVVGVGQVGFWLVMASVHVWLDERPTHTGRDERPVVASDV